MITTAPGEPLAAGAEGDGPAPATLPGLLLAHAEARPAAVALRKKDLGRWREYRWEEYARRSARVGLGLLEIGVGPGDRVAVHSENRPSWLFADLGIQGIGAVTVGIYPTSPPSEVESATPARWCSSLRTRSSWTRHWRCGPGSPSCAPSSSSTLGA